MCKNWNYMKKVLFTALSLIAMLFITSCSNEDIEIATVGKKYTLSYTVNTEEMYKCFGIDSYIQEEFLRDESREIGVLTYVYNSEGLLVAEDIKTLYSFNSITQSFELTEGNYTIVTIETLLNPDNEYKADVWTFEDVEKLSTIKIKQQINRAFRSDVLGISVQEEIPLYEDSQIMAIPEPIGSIINFHAYNFENSDFLNIGFGTSDIIDYYLINPKIARDNRFITNKTTSNNFRLRGELSRKNIIDGYYLPLYIFEKEIHCKPAVQDEKNAGTNGWYTWNNETVQLKDGEIYEYGFYYVKSDGENHYTSSKFTSNYSDLLAWKEEIDNELNQSDILFKEPYMTWGGSVSAVKSYMTGYEVGNNGNLIEDEDGTYCLWYYGKNKVSEIDYWFTSKTGGLTEVYLFFDSKTVGENDLSNAFSELGYTFLMSESGLSLYSTKDGLSYVIVGLNPNGYWYVNYFANSYSAIKHKMNKKLRSFVPKRTIAQCAHNEFCIDELSITGRMRECEKVIRQEYLK